MFWFVAQLGKPCEVLLFSNPRGFLCHFIWTTTRGCYLNWWVISPGAKLLASNASDKLIVQTLCCEDLSLSNRNFSYTWWKQDAFCEHVNGHTRRAFALQCLVALNKVKRAKLWRDRVWWLILPLFSALLHWNGCWFKRLALYFPVLSFLCPPPQPLPLSPY